MLLGLLVLHDNKIRLNHFHIHKYNLKNIDLALLLVR